MTAFGESDHTAENSIQENFDRISKENYDRLDRELDESLKSIPEKHEKTWKLILEIVWWFFLVLCGFGMGVFSNYLR